MYFFYNYSQMVRKIYKRLFQSNKEVKHYYQNWNETTPIAIHQTGLMKFYWT